MLPYTKTGVVGGIMLGLGRALGETMAVTFVIGNFNQLNSLSLFEAAQQHHLGARQRVRRGRRRALHQASLIDLGLILFLITFVVLALSKLLLHAARSSAKESRMSAASSTRADAAELTRAPRLHARRKRINVVALTLALAAMAFGLFWLVWILVETVRLGHRRRWRCRSSPR